MTNTTDDTRALKDSRFTLVASLEAALKALEHLPTVPNGQYPGDVGVVWWGSELCYTDTPDGRDYTRICRQHHWASLPFYAVEDGLVCPFCRTELDAGRGRARYRQLQGADRQGRRNDDETVSNAR